MNKILAIVLTLALVLFLGAITNDAAAQTAGKAAKTSVGPHGPIDSDGDGIPNHSDPDYTKPQDGTGNTFGKMHSGKGSVGKAHGNSFGPGDGTGKSGIGPRDGSGFGRGNGTGICDGTGPKGSRRGR